MTAYTFLSPPASFEHDPIAGLLPDGLSFIGSNGDKHSPFAEPVSLSTPPQSSADASCWTFGDVVFIRSVSPNAPAGAGMNPWHDWFDRWGVVLLRSPSDDPSPLPQANTRQGRLTFHPPGSPCACEAHDGELLTLLLPRDFCREAFDVSGCTPDLDIDPELGGLLAGFMDNLARQLPHISPDHFPGLAAATRSVVAACILPSRERSETDAVPLASLLIDQARLLVRQHMACPTFGPDRLARAMAMSRSKLYRLFESTGGVAHFINRERLREAHRCLTGSAHPHSIHIIANEVGFTDHSTFSRAFRREFGYTPTEARDRGAARLSKDRIGPALHDAQPNTAFNSPVASGGGDGPADAQFLAAVPAHRQG